ncbi:MAG: HDOD domain-containing protein [Campylobacterales bacterium]|nr:HDOD domain-containing protein [Campylobacterales bacterium]
MMKCHDEEIFEEFRLQFTDGLETIWHQIEALKHNGLEGGAVHELFRTLHSNKAIAQYLGLEPMYRLFSNAEELLCNLRNQTTEVNEAVIEWLRSMYELFVCWSEELQMRDCVLTPAPALLSDIAALTPERSPAELLRERTVVYIDADEPMGRRVVAGLSKIVREAIHVRRIDELVRIARSKIPDIILINSAAEALDHAALCRELFPKAAQIVALEHLDRKRRLKLALSDVTHPIARPIRSDELKRELLSVTASHYGRHRTIITHRKIHDFIQTLSPLPGSLYRIIALCDDEEASIRELAKVIRQDPVISAMLLDAAAKPSYGLSNIATVDQAVAAFGKRIVKALVLSLSRSMIGEHDLSPCGIDELLFSKVVELRLALMMRWYAKVSVGDLGVLSSCSVLGNIGQLLVAREMKHYGKAEAFRRYCEEHGPDAAVHTFLHTSIAFVSSDLLRYWHLDGRIIDAIRYSDRPERAPLEIRRLAWANHIVYQMVSIRGEVAYELPKPLRQAMEKLELQPDILEAVLKQLGQ